MISYRQADIFERMKDTQKPVGVINFYNPGDDYIMVENEQISEDKILDDKAKDVLSNSGFITNEEGRFYYVCDASDPGVATPAELIAAVYMQLVHRGIESRISITNISDKNGKAKIELLP